jgi:hypothetical protein
MDTPYMPHSGVLAPFLWNAYICRKQFNSIISAFFIYKIENFPIRLAIFDVFQSHFAQLSMWIINILYTQFCMSYIGTYKFPYKWSLYSGLPAVWQISFQQWPIVNAPLWGNPKTGGPFLQGQAGHQQNRWLYLRVSTPYTIIQSIQKST